MASSLNDFVSKFTSSEQKYVDTIDTLQTFDISFAFYPNIAELNASDDGKFSLSKLSKSMVSAAKGAVKSAANNLTGGILGSIMNDVDIMEMKKNFMEMKKNFKVCGETTALDYISRGNLLTQDDSWFGGASEDIKSQLILDFSLYVQSASLPQITTGGEETSETLLGVFPINGRYVKPSANSFQLTFINTKAPLMERIFYPWLKETTLPFWSYDRQPYTTANVTVDFNKHADFKYLFVGTRPSSIETMQPSNELGSPTRQVTFIFDHMFVLSDFKNTETWDEKLLGVGKSLLGSAGTTLGL